MKSIDEVVNQATKRYLDVFSTHLQRSEGKNLYAADLVMFGLVTRNIGLLKAMPALFESKNIHALAPLLRVQLDSLLRLHAYRIVESMDGLAKHVISGKNLRNYKDRNGSFLRDSHLVSTLKVELPWVASMYDTLSGWVHFSESHVFSAATLGASENSIVVGVGGCEKEIPESLFTEACGAVGAMHGATATLLEAYFERHYGA
jgi:hypothetical protein